MATVSQNEPSEDLKYFYYRITEDSLALTCQQAFDPQDPSMGRVLAHRILPPTVSSFKKALSRLEGISFSRIIALKFSTDPESSALLDTITLSTMDRAAPGASPSRPIIITIAKVVNGVAEVVMSTTEPGKAATAERPDGWAICDCRLTSTSSLSARLDNLDGVVLTPARISVYPSSDLFFANVKRPQAGVRDGKPMKVVQVILLPDRTVGYIKAEVAHVLVE
ncbi:hypothetical protein DL93DRAFT_2228397 [Clavulina sp. PMI_390]|nr:hypothetical protein DL93DRAFT_2228397 [Clavulina sp. PMI_390]